MEEQVSRGRIEPAWGDVSLSPARSANRHALVSPALAANVLAVLTALALIWLPEVSLYWVGPTRVSDDSVLQAKHTPRPEVLTEIGQQSLLPIIDPADMIEPSSLRALGEGVLSGNVQFAGRPMANLPFPFRATHLDTGLPSHTLKIAGLGTLRLLLAAYAATGEPRFIDAALRETLSFNEVDAWRLVPRGLLWNDHALAARVQPLAQLWSLVRDRTDLDPSQALALLQLADRTGARLAKPELYNSRTNHGIMQNIALIQLSLAFPTLPRAERYRAMGCKRMVTQMPYYVAPEGPVLEHSAEYHAAGRDLLIKAIRLFELSGCAIPPVWYQLLARATAFSHLLQRPDRTLPVFGNTDHAPLPTELSVDPGIAPDPPARVYEVAGFAVSWRGTEAWPEAQHLSQTVVTWSNFPTRAHKHADDMALALWAKGQSWITNSGYWPYDAEGYDEANGWRGSNAPHFEGEAPRVPRETVLLAAGASQSLWAIDLERRLANGASVRRQVVEVGGEVWIVLDSAVGDRDRRIETLWTTMPEIELQPIGEREFLLRSVHSATYARMLIAGSLAGTPTVRRGSLAPFAGWIVRAGQPVPAAAIQIHQLADQRPVATVLRFGEEAAPVRFQSSGANEWEIRLEGARDGFLLRRQKGMLSLQFAGGREERVELAAANDVRERRQVIVSAYEAANREFPGVRERIYYRYRLTALALFLLVLQEVTIAVTRRVLPRAVMPVRMAASIAWLSFGLLAAFWYLR
jgi:hypothetical protein